MLKTLKPYRYRHFERAHMEGDDAFEPSPGPGDALPAFDMMTTEGRRVTDADFRNRPLFITFGSITCPMTKSAGPTLKHFYRQYGDRVAFLTVYVREAHPGSRYPQPDTLDQKLAHARAYKRRDHIPWTVAVDDIEGTFHRSLDPKPNSAYFVDAKGRIRYRALWSNDPGLVHGFRALLAREQYRSGTREAQSVALLTGLGAMSEVLRQAGEPAPSDFRRAMPGAWALAAVADAFRPLNFLARGIAAVAVVTAAGGALAWLVARRAASA